MWGSAKRVFFTKSEWWIIGSSARSCSQAFVKVTSADLVKEAWANAGSMVRQENTESTMLS